MIHLIFKHLSDRRPERDSKIVWIRRTGSHGIEDVELVTSTVRYMIEKDGTTCPLKEGEYIPKDHRFLILFDGHEATEEDVWVYVEEFFRQLDEIYH